MAMECLTSTKSRIHEGLASKCIYPISGCRFFVLLAQGFVFPWANLRICKGRCSSTGCH